MSNYLCFCYGLFIISWDLKPFNNWRITCRIWKIAHSINLFFLFVDHVLCTLINKYSLSFLNTFTMHIRVACPFIKKVKTKLSKILLDFFFPCITTASPYKYSIQHGRREYLLEDLKLVLKTNYRFYVNKRIQTFYVYMCYI